MNCLLVFMWMGRQNECELRILNDENFLRKNELLNREILAVALGWKASVKKV